MGLRRSSLAILALGLLSVGPESVLAQTTNATCQSSFNWMNNSKSQNPCLVAAYLQAQCNNGQFFVDALPTGDHYTGPYADESNACQCSSVTYNAVSACGLCQAAEIISWSSWNTNCTTIYPDVFLPGVPSGTAVPQWAFQDVTISNLFNATLAQTVGDSPESTATNAQSTGSVVATSAAAASVTGSPSVSSTSSPASLSGGSSSSNTAAIAGGVVGGVVGVALIAAVIVFAFMRKKRSRVLPSGQFAAVPTSSGYPSPGYADTTPFAPQMAQPKLYDPSDPSTFPASPPPTTVTSGSSNNILSPTTNYSSGYYSGAPEI